MKFITNNKITKKIIIAIIIVMLFNFIAPVCSKATDEEGGDLLNPISEFICAIGDLVIKVMQKVFIGYGDIKDDTGFNIFYGPKNIFSGALPIFDINFINPKEDITLTIPATSTSEGESDEKTEPSEVNGNAQNQQLIQTMQSIINWRDTNGELLTKEHYINGINQDDVNKFNSLLSFLNRAKELSTTANENTLIEGAITGVQGIIDNTDTINQWIEEEGINVDIFYSNLEELRQNMAQFVNIEDVYNEDINVDYNETTEITSKSSAAVLQSVISKWYKALRTIAFVGLLSVIVYIGIRIIISSTGQEKAKYKNMIMGWITAICILFVLHFIMAFILEITETLTNIIVQNTTEATTGNESAITIERDELISEIRNEVGIEPNFRQSFAKMIIYLALVVYTVIFTITYLKRVVYMGFFTMIAPLIALTYPLDKIKDGQAQAFGMWIKEYTFNALLQVMHILLYTILIDSANTLFEQGNWIYAIVAIGFLVPAEKFFRKMFGFEKAGTISPLGAAAGGAAIMNMMNKVKSKSSGGGNSKEEKSTSDKTNQRTAGGEHKMSNPTEAWSETKQTPLERANSSQQEDEEEKRSLRDRAQDFRSQHINNNRVINGIKAVAGNKFTGKKIAKYVGKKALKATLGATMGTIGLAAGVATGDLSKAAKFGAGGLIAGSAIGGGVVNRAERAAQEFAKTRDLFRQGYEGTEYNQRQNERLDKEFMNSAENKLFFRTHFEDYKQAMEDALIARQNGITDNKEIKKILDIAYKEKGDRTNNVQKMVGVAILSEQLKDGYNKKETREDFKQGIIKNLQKRGVANPENQAEKIMTDIGRYRGLVL